MAKEAPWPVLQDMNGDGPGGQMAYIKAKKRLEALLQRELYPPDGAPAPTGRPSSSDAGNTRGRSSVSIDARYTTSTS